jgi:hypothetical protein
VVAAIALEARILSTRQISAEYDYDLTSEDCGVWGNLSDKPTLPIELAQKPVAKNIDIASTVCP